MTVRPEVVVDSGAILGEAPVWDAARGELVWADVPGRRLHRTDPRTGADRARSFDQPVAAIAPAGADRWLLGLGGSVALLDSADATPYELVALGTGDRANDGGCDPAGRFYVGTMTVDQVPGVCSLHRLDRDEQGWQALPVVTGVTVSNGFDWGPDGTLLYYVDTPTLRVDAFDYDVSTGTISDRRVFADLRDAPGRPDGLTVDAEGGVWVAVVRGGELRRYAADGTLDEIVHFPVPWVTSCAFGGDALDELFVTTGRDPSGPESPPLAGAVFRLRPGVTGRPPTPWSGPA